MVSPLWNATSQGDLDSVKEFLKDPSVDVNAQDQSGSTPLIEAVKKGDVQIVQALLGRGADPNRASEQGPPQQHTSDPAILELLSAAQQRFVTADSKPDAQNGYSHDLNGDANKTYYPQPPYPYYPAYSGVPPMPDGAMYYPPPMPPHPGSDGAAHVPGHLPPPDIARMIPCRYFPACRYGSSCMFLHPQPYMQGPLPPPAQYSASYDPQHYPPSYYPISPPPFQQHGSMPPMPGMPSSPPPSMPRSAAEQAPPQPQFSPGAGPPQGPYPHVSPMVSPYAGPMPVAMGPPLPPPGGGPSPPTAPTQSPMYPPNSPPANAYPMPPLNGVMPYGAAPVPVHPGSYPEVNGAVKSPPLNPQPDGYAHPPPPPREPVGHVRRGSAARRGSFVNRKPPCLFFPAGRCKNGDDCRFPHIMPDAAAQNNYFSGGRGGSMRSRGHGPGNAFGTIEEKLAGLSLRDDQYRDQANGSSSSRSQSIDPNGRSRFNGGMKNGFGPPHKRPPLPKQRVPNADEFPTLGGAPAPAKAMNGISGPTAAQVLQAPAPVRKDSTRENSTRGPSPDSASWKQSQADSEVTTPDVASAEQAKPLQAPAKIPISFAAATVGNSATAEGAQEVSVSA